MDVQTEKRQQENLQRSIAAELEWVNANAKGQVKKGKARMRRFEDLEKQVIIFTSLCCSPAPPLLPLPPTPSCAPFSIPWISSRALLPASCVLHVN